MTKASFKDSRRVPINVDQISDVLVGGKSDSIHVHQLFNSLKRPGAFPVVDDGSGFDLAYARQGFQLRSRCGVDV